MELNSIATRIGEARRALNAAVAELDDAAPTSSIVGHIDAASAALTGTKFQAGTDDALATARSMIAGGAGGMNVRDALLPARQHVDRGIRELELAEVPMALVRGEEAAPEPTTWSPKAFETRAADGSRTIGISEAEAMQIVKRVHGEQREALGPMLADLVHDTHRLAAADPHTLPRAGEDIVDGKPFPVDYLVDQMKGKGQADLDEELLEARPMLVSKQFVGSDDGTGVDIKLPVSAYGERLTRAIVQATRSVYARVLDAHEPQARAAAAIYYENLDTWTFRRSRALTTTTEGVLSHAQALAQLTVHEVPGMSATELLNALRDGKLVNRMATGPIGVTATLTNYGVVPKAVVSRAADGSLDLAPELRALQTSFADKRKVHPFASPSTGRGCPFAAAVHAARPSEEPGRKSELMRMNSAFVDLVKQYYAADVRDPIEAAT